MKPRRAWPQFRSTLAQSGIAMRGIFLLLMATSATCGLAATTISATNSFSYGANIGWINCGADVASGAQIGEFYCAGKIYSANAGWISLGSGNPANGYAYANNSPQDYGVNVDFQGNLRGFAYGANIGWINFENLGAAKVDRRSGALSGHAYSANCGWLSLSNIQAKVATESLWPGALAPDGLPVAWRNIYLDWQARATDDPDDDGADNLMEYQAGTDPLEARDVLKIIKIQLTAPTVSITWNSVPERDYILQSAATPAGPWTNALSARSSNRSYWITRELPVPGSSTRFYRVQALRPF